jgi:hypothetical protein
MLTALLLIALVALTVFVLANAWVNRKRGFGGPLFANVGEGTHEDAITKLSSAAMATRYLLVKKGADDDHIAITAANTDIPMGVCTDEASAAEEYVGVALLGSAARTTRKMVASEAIAVGEAVYGAAAGKVQGLPAGSSGAHFMVGRALTPATNDGDVIEVQTVCPIAQTF